MKKRALGLLIALLLVTVGAATPTPDAATKTGVWQYRRTLTVYEKGGVSRKSYAIDLALSKSELADTASDLRLTDNKGTLLPYQIVSIENGKVTVRIPVDLEPNGRKAFYIYYGNPQAQPPQRVFVGSENMIGNDFVSLAIGEVKICSYSKDNKITVTDVAGNYIKDIFGRTISPETYPAGGIRSFKPENPTVIRIQSTGLCSVAMGNFAKEETDCTAFISGEALVFVPSFLAITSLRDGNNVSVFNRGELAKKAILNSNQTLVFDNLPAGMRKIQSDYDCAIQYGTASSYSFFSVPQKGLVYSYLPLGPTAIVAHQNNTELFVTWSDPTIPPQKFELSSAGQMQRLETKSPLIKKSEIYNATTITSNKPITVLAMGTQGGHGATFLPGVDGKLLSKRWNTVSGPIDPKNPSNRNIALIAPYSKTTLSSPTERRVFPPLPSSPMSTSLVSVTTEFSPVLAQTNQYAVILDANPDDTALLYQVPPIKDKSIIFTLSDPEAAPEGSTWMPESPVSPGGEPGKQEQPNENFFTSLWKTLTNPTENPMQFSLVLLFAALILITIAVLLWRRSKHSPEDDADDEDEEKTEAKEDNTTQPLYQDDGISQARVDFEALEELDKEPPVKPEEKAEEKDFSENWPKQEATKQTQAQQTTTKQPGENMRTPKLRLPNLSKFLSQEATNSINSSNETTAKEEPPCSHETPPPPAEERHEEAPMVMPSPMVQETKEPEEPEIDVTESEIAQPSVISEAVAQLADQMNKMGVVADPGAIMRLHKEGLLPLLSKISIAHTAYSLLPGELSIDPRFERIPIMGKEAERANKISSELGVFEEVGRALVVAEKTRSEFYITTARLPERMGKLKVVHVERFIG